MTRIETIGMNIHDHGQHDPIEFDLGSWSHVARKAKECIESEMGRELTNVPLPNEVSDEH